jgi:glutathione synthase
VYFRAGYVPAHFPTEVEWRAREMLERSTAIKCPWLGLQLANTKKVQQVLAGAGIVERFVPRHADWSDATYEQRCEHVRSTFAGLWSLAKADGQDIGRCSSGVAQ